MFARGTHVIEHAKFFRRVGEGLLDGFVVFLDTAGYGRPEIGAGLDKGEGQGNGQVGNGGSVGIDKLGIFEEAIRQGFEVSFQQFGEFFLGHSVVAFHSENNVSDGRKAVMQQQDGEIREFRIETIGIHILTLYDYFYLPWIHGSLTPVESKIDLSSLERIGGIQLLTILGDVAEVPHDGG